MSEIAERVKKIVVEHLGVEPEKVVDNASFIDDLGAASLDTVELVKADDFIIIAKSAARQALDDANWHPNNEVDCCATGTMIGSGIVGLSGIADTALLLKERGPRKVSPFFIPGRRINLASGYVSIEHGLKGPNHSVVTACSTGAHAIGA